MVVRPRLHAGPFRRIRRTTDPAATHPAPAATDARRERAGLAGFGVLAAATAVLLVWAHGRPHVGPAPEAAAESGRAQRWRHLAREPYVLETSRPGVFAAGDVRSGSIKRVASAVGEGSMSVRLVHEYLRETGASADR